MVTGLLGLAAASPGRMEFVCEWPAAGLPLTRTELDAAAIIAAAPRAQVAFVD
jgi:hypothetical protein